MRQWFVAPVFEDIETTRQAQMLWRILRAMMLLIGVGAAAAIFDDRNSVDVTVIFYGLVLMGFLVVAGIIRRGRTVLAAWIFSLFFWCLIAFVTLAFGGLQGQNASVFAVCTLLVGSIVGGRAAIGMAIASSVWGAFVCVLEYTGRLPWNIGPYTPGNAWAALTITVVLTSVLLHESLNSVRRMHKQAERAAAERDEALRRSIQGQKMELVGNLTSGVAHDLNNLLTVIVGTVDLLRSSPAADDPAAVALMDDLDGAASRSALMTSQLLALGRAKAGRGEPVDVGLLLEANGKMAARLLGSSIEVETRTVEGCWVIASPSAIEQILLNLVVNARDAMPNGGKLQLRVAREGVHVVLSVKDTGVGISTDIQDRIFEPFFTTKSHGTGLGLATIRQLATQYGGTVEVRSELGKGTTFLVSFLKVPAPVDRENAQLATQLERTGPASARGRILLVEDDPMVRKTLSQMLILDGYDVTAVADGDEALAILSAVDAFACVVTDISMRRVDGDVLAHRLRVSHPKLPVIIVSGNREMPTHESGPTRLFIEKPVAHADLRAAIRRVIEQPY
jgi:signal transduction histidine kinase/CheY-like chemotaxis protein